MPRKETGNPLLNGNSKHLRVVIVEQEIICPFHTTLSHNTPEDYVPPIILTIYRDIFRKSNPCQFFTHHSQRLLRKGYGSAYTIKARVIYLGLNESPKGSISRTVLSTEKLLQSACKYKRVILTKDKPIALSVFK
jgi:hypothetical protein